jgi:NDP-sugar pyrophosphorylase family protein
MPAMVLSAGLGTRLRPLSSWLAKPLVPVGDRAALAHVLERIRAFGGPTLVNVHHRAEQLRAFLEKEGPNVIISEEKELLDTGGGVRRALEVLGAPATPGPARDLLVWNGDTLTDLDLPALRGSHAENPGSAGATLVVRPSATPEGNVGLDADGRVVRLRRQTMRAGEVRAADFLGIQVIGEELFARLPERGGLVEAFYLPLLAEGVAVRAWETRAPFHDIGTLASYLAANLAWLADRGASSFVAEGATVAAGVRIDRAIVGAGARVEGEGTLARSVVWPGATAVAPLEGAIVTPFGVAFAPTE